MRAHMYVVHLPKCVNDNPRSRCLQVLSNAFIKNKFSLRAWADGRLHAEVTEKRHLDFVLVNFRLTFLALVAGFFLLWYGILLIRELNQFCIWSAQFSCFM